MKNIPAHVLFAGFAVVFALFACLLSLLGGCGAAPEPEAAFTVTVPIDLPPPLTITPNPPVVPPPPPAGVALDAPCVPDVGQWLPAGARCQLGLTCRVRGAHDGVCRPIGALPQGAVATGEAECGSNMLIMSDSFGQTRCALICFPQASGSRCKGRPCAPFINDELGVCQ